MTAIPETPQTVRRAKPNTIYMGYDICNNSDCRTLSDLYGGLPQCTECLGNFCHGCMAECSEPDEDHFGRGICKRCKAEVEADQA